MGAIMPPAFESPVPPLSKTSKKVNTGALRYVDRLWTPFYSGGMAEPDTLERLINDLSLEERHSMLEKLQSLSVLPGESLYPAPVESEAGPSLEEQYAKLPWYYRLFYFIVSLFKNRLPQQIFLDSRIAKLGRRIDLEYPQFYDSQKSLLLPEFHQLLTALKDDARFFFDALDVSVNRDRGSFFAFLGSLEMAEVHRALEAETDPERLRNKNPPVPDLELRQTATRVMEEALAGVTEAQRALMYRNARSLQCLKELSSFLYDRVLLAFSSPESGQSCSIHVVKDMLGSLNNILFSLKEPPSLTLLESLFIFILQARSGEPGFDRNQALQRLLHRAEGALGNIRNFNKRLPLTLILKCGNRDMAYYPRQISGGEDWYAMYRDYWRRHINSRLNAYMKDRGRRRLRELYRAFFRGAEPLILENAPADGEGDGCPVDTAQSLSFLLTFHKLVFVPEINSVLLPIVADGEFINKENRAEFTGAYNNLAKLGDEIHGFDEKIGPQGIYGEHYAQARHDMSSLPVKRRKIQLVLDDAGGEGRGIVEKAKVSIDSITNIIAGILKKEPGGRYDSLSNLPQMEARIPNFQANLREIGEKFSNTRRILEDVIVLEAENAKN
ncbi:MAG: DUF5312 domain-containing protein [Treponema sp.]|jgi:hypothetical protein|nr:DUF5312 domain-containing protein [Treponema sp.]